MMMSIFSSEVRIRCRSRRPARANSLVSLSSRVMRSSESIRRSEMCDSNKRPEFQLWFGFQLDSGAARIHSGKRNRQMTFDIVLAQERLRCGFLQTRHVAVCDKVGFQFRKARSEEHTSELQSRGHLVCRL